MSSPFESWYESKGSPDVKGPDPEPISDRAADALADFILFDATLRGDIEETE